MNPVSLFDMEAMAKEVMQHNRWTFVDAGAADEITMQEGTGRPLTTLQSTRDFW